MNTYSTEMNPLFPSQVSTQSSKPGITHTLVSKVLFAVLAPFAVLGAYDLLRGLVFAQAGELTIGDVGMVGYILSGLLLWLALLAVTDLPGLGKIVTQIVWGSHVLFNVLAIPYWIFWQPLLHQSSLGFTGLGWLAGLVIFPVLAVSSACLLFSLVNTNHTP